MKVRQAIEELRSRYGSQAALARMLGISSGYLSDIKSGRRTGGTYAKEIINLSNNPKGIPISGAIKELSKKFGTQKKLAKELGISESYLSEIKHGKKRGLSLSEKLISLMSKRKPAFKKIREIPDIQGIPDLADKIRKGLSWERSIHDAKLYSDYRWFARFLVTFWITPGGGSGRRVVKDGNIPTNLIATNINTMILTLDGELLVNTKDFINNWEKMVDNARETLLRDPAIIDASFLYVCRHFREYQKGVPILHESD